MTKEEKKKILEDAKKQGIVDIDCHDKNGNEKISYETIKLATELTKKHAPETYKRMEERRRQQKNGK
jgi:RecB family endonuclease NucS